MVLVFTLIVLLGSLLIFTGGIWIGIEYQQRKDAEAVRVRRRYLYNKKGELERL